jgi:hypothetical protein
MNATTRPLLVARSLKVLPAIVIVVAGLVEAHTSRELVRSKPAPDAVIMLASAGPLARTTLSRSERMNRKIRRSEGD